MGSNYVDVEFAIIFTSDEDFEAAHAIFDHEYKRQSLHPYAYSFGRICGHNTVLVMSEEDYINNSDARGIQNASFAKDFFPSFLRVELVFVVGTCGDDHTTTKDRHISLGDVILSETTVAYTQNDHEWHDKISSESNRVNLGSQNTGFQGLLAKQEPVKELEGLQQRVCGNIAMLQRTLRESSRFARPRHDILTAQDHPASSLDEPLANSPSPNIHFQEATSGDNLLKYVEDWIDCATLDGVLTSKIMNRDSHPYLSCIIVKSICEAESNNDGVWKSFATVVAVACAKALIEQLTPSSAASVLVHEYAVSTVVFAPNGALAAYGDSNGTVRLRNTTDGSLLQKFENSSSLVEAMAFSIDSKQLALAFGDGTVQLCDVSTGAQVWTAHYPAQDVIVMAFSPDDELLALGYVYGDIKLCDRATGALLRTLHANNESVRSIAFLSGPGGIQLMSACLTGVVSLWDVTTGDLLETLSSEGKRHHRYIALAPDGSQLAFTEPLALKLKDFTPRRIRTRTLSHHSLSASASSISFDALGKRLVSAFSDWTVRLWDTKSGALLQTFQTYDGRTLFVAAVQDGLRIAENGIDGDMRLYCVITLDGDDTESDFSDTSDDSYDSSSPIEETPMVRLRMKRLQREELVAVATYLFHNDELKICYVAAVKRLGQRRFSKGHSRMLKRLIKDLKQQESDSRLTEWISQALHNNTQRSRVSNLIARLAQYDIYQYQTKMAASLLTERMGTLSGKPFHEFKANLNGIIYQLDITIALRGGNLKDLERLLRRSFKDVAEGEYSWLRELVDIGYTTHDLARLLFEDAKYAPWVYPRPQPVDTRSLNERMHEIFLTESFSNLNSMFPTTVVEPQYSPVASTPTATENDLKRLVEELCGIAGIGLERNTLETSVRCEDARSTISVTYGNLLRERSGGLSRVRSIAAFRSLEKASIAMEKFCQAVEHVRKSMRCGNYFTFLRQEYNKNATRSYQVEVCQVEFASVTEFRSTLMRWRHQHRSIRETGHINTVTEEAIACWDAANRILRPLLQISDLAAPSTLRAVSHICSLAAQFLSVAFLSYCQAHIGPIHPFFTDTPLRKFYLMGSRVMTSGTVRIRANLVKLTCVSEMVGGLVLAFDPFVPGNDAPEVSITQPHDVLASAEDILDTWGPGQLIRHTSMEAPCAISICGGFIAASDETGKTFHWSQTWDASQPIVALDPKRKIVVGVVSPQSLVRVNSACVLDVRRFWQNSTHVMRFLGTFEPHWESQSIQIGLQGGQFVSGVLNQTWQKCQGVTLKQALLSQDVERLVQSLECTWGLRVSFCTTVAERVSLRKLVADVLAVSVTAFLIPTPIWLELQSFNIIKEFETGDVFSWICGLRKPLREQVLKIIRQILVNLQDTGLNRVGRTLTVAWLDEKSTGQCFKIPCEDQTYWARILADTADCATFAYLSPKCLECASIACRGSPEAWAGASQLLATAVVAPGVAGLASAKDLKHGDSYHIQAATSLFRLVVHRPDRREIAQLIATPSTIPPRIQHRIRFGEPWKSKGKRLRERQRMQEPAEEVLIIAPSRLPGVRLPLRERFLTALEAEGASVS